MIYITGDTHGDFSRLENDMVPKIDKEDYVIICGDFGGIWNAKETRSERKLLKDLKKLNCTVLFIDGNHENFDRLYKYPITEWHGGKVHKINDNVFHLMRGEIFDINNKKFFVFGGASCHDISDGILNPDEIFRKEKFDKEGKSYRIRGISWWDLELPTKEELENGINNLEKNNFDVDYVITHCLPTSIQKDINNYFPENKLTNYFDSLLSKLKFKKWYCGHYHENINKNKFKILYEDIDEIK